MRQDGRLVRMIHVLVHMGLLDGRETSETLARMLNTNPVVVRRMMSGLKRKGIVGSEGGRGGGWILLKPLDELSVLDVQTALTDGDILVATRSTDHPSCPVERAANAALSEAFAKAEATLRDGFGRMKLSTIANAALNSEGGRRGHP